MIESRSERNYDLRKSNGNELWNKKKRKMYKRISVEMKKRKEKKRMKNVFFQSWSQTRKKAKAVISSFERDGEFFVESF